MSFLAPFYIAGALAVGLPILFHLIRRSPRGRVRFSSLMFLRSSPPRITRRSRLDNLLLLILRAAVVCLLALAFARPFLREAAHLGFDEGGKRLVLLVDTSASMRRGDLWSQAVARVHSVLDDAKPADQVALYTFDDRVRKQLGFDDGQVPPGARVEWIKKALEKVQPTWGGSNLGEALVAVADILDVSGDDSAAESRASSGALQIVLVTDLQRGSGLDALTAYDWPERVRLTVERVAPKKMSNAGLVLLPGSESPASESSGDPSSGDLSSGNASSGKRRHRVRVTNEVSSVREQFELRWTSEEKKSIVAAAGVYVPAGESRVVSLESPAQGFGENGLVLTGDDHDFDNTFHVAPSRRDEITVLYVGTETADDAKDLRYYVERALASDGRRDVRFVSHPPDAPLAPEDEGPGSRRPRLVIVTANVATPLQNGLVRYMQAGGTVLYVVKDAGSQQTLAALLGQETLGVEEVEAGDYAMMSEIDFSHPVFSSFADPRFSDFTKIRFWRHRRLRLDTEEKQAGLRVLARFDDGDPAVVERAHGAGRLLALTSGWQPSDSQLALSTKFVPLLAGLVESLTGRAVDRRTVHVGGSVPVPSGRERKVRSPDGSELPLATSAASFEDTDEPGIYEMEIDGVRLPFAVNLAPAESETAPLPVESLERQGVRLGGPREAETDRERQMRDLELESSQKLWRWVVAVALGLLILETWLAGRLGRSVFQKEAEAAV